MSIPAPTPYPVACNWRRNFRPGVRLSPAAGGNSGARAGSREPPRRRDRHERERRISASSSARKVFFPPSRLLATDRLARPERPASARRSARSALHSCAAASLVPRAARAAFPADHSSVFGRARNGGSSRKFSRHTQPPAEDESIAAFVRRKFGDELLEPAGGPFRFRRLCGRSGKAEPARRVSEASRIRSEVWKRADGRHEVSAAQGHAARRAVLLSRWDGNTAARARRAPGRFAACSKPAWQLCATARPTESRGLKSNVTRHNHQRNDARPAPSSSPLPRMSRRKS